MTASVHDAARAALAAGLCPVPPMQDGTKRPEGTWKEYQSRRSTAAELASWYANGHRTGLGIVTGAVSGNLELFEFEGRAVAEGIWQAFLERAKETGLIDLLRRMKTGFLERSPSGGWHFLYRCDVIEGNTKLARRPATPEELADNPDDRFRVLIETKGKGGYVIVAPSNGRVHPGGGAWELKSGGFDTIPTITPDEREDLWALARSFDLVAAQREPVGNATAPAPGGDVRPGDDFAARTSWAAILEPHGWHRLFVAADGNEHWRRPGKSIGTSATIKDRGEGPLYVFSSSTPFDPERAYTKFAAYAVLEHGGDFRAAARQLGHDGFGSSATHGTGTLPPRASTGGPEDEFQRTDAGNAHRFLQGHGDELRHCPELRQWHRWDGRRWAPVASERVAALVLRATEARLLTALDARDQAEIKWAVQSQNRGRLEAALAVAGLLDAIHVGVDALDARLDLLTTLDGVVDLTTGELGPHSRDHLGTKLAPVTFVGTKGDEDWATFLEAMIPDPEVRNWFQRLVGCALLGRNREERLPILVGPEGTGKTTTLEAIRCALGGYCAVVPFDALLESHSGGAARPELVQLLGKRVVVASETNERERWNAPLVKALTGNEAITARALYRDPITFLPSFTVIAAANATPRVDHEDGAMWRRLAVIRFDVQPGRRDPRVKALLTEPEKAGGAVLRWLVAGALAYQRDGLGDDPAAVRAATEAYRTAQDRIAGFVDDHLVVTHDQADRLSAAEIYSQYRQWCQDNGVRYPLAQKGVAALLVARGCTAGRSSATRWWTGVRWSGADDVASPENDLSHDVYDVVTTLSTTLSREDTYKKSVKPDASRQLTSWEVAAPPCSECGGPTRMRPNAHGDLPFCDACNGWSR